jgi:hypothetical protein
LNNLPDRIALFKDGAGRRINLFAIDHFSAPDRRISFVPSRLTLETMGGEVIGVRDDPRSAFAGQTNESPWDTLHVAYFTSYALWTYLNLPFIYTYPGFVTEEIESWRENGEEWRRLKATFPETIASHSGEQITYFGPDGLMRRHDYTVEVLGDGNGQKIPAPLLVSIDIETIVFS